MGELKKSDKKMKKKALKKDFYMEIKKSLGRFLSIFFIVALGVSFFAGIRASEPDMRLSGDEYFDELNLADMKIISTMGLTEKDAETIKTISGVEALESGYSVDAMCKIEDTKKVVHVMSDLEMMNRPVVEEGRMPKSEEECLMDVDFMKASGYKIGDEIELESGIDDSLTDSLKHTTFRIVGAGSSPCYISFERGSSMIGTGEVSGFLIVPKRAFSMEVYTEFYMRVDGAFDEVAFTKAYDDKVARVVENVDSIRSVMQQARRDQIVDDAEDEIRDAEIELSDAKRKLSDGREAWEDGKRELESGKTEVANAKTELENGKEALKVGRQELEKGKQELADGENAFSKEKKKAEQQLASSKKILLDSEKELENGKRQLASGEKELADGKAFLLEKQQELEDGKAKYEAGVAQLNEGKKLLAENEKKLDQAKQSLPKLNAAIRGAEKGVEELGKLVANAQKGLALAEKEANRRQQQYEEAKRAWESGSGEVTEAEVKALKELADAAQKTYVDLAKNYNKLQTSYEKAKQALDELKQKLDQLQAEIERGEKELASGKAELLANEKLLAESKVQLEEGQKQIDQGKEKLEASEKELNDAKATIQKGEAKLQSGWKSYHSGKQEANRKLAAGEQKLLQGKQEVAAAEKKVQDGEQEIADGERQLADAEKEILDGEQELSDREQEILDGEQEILDGEQELADAKQEVQDIDMPKWYVYDRDVFEQYTGYGENADRMSAIGQVFPVLFFLVAALISLTTMTRMVEEQRVQIGTLKALGYSKFSIAGKYLGYAFVATLGGSIVGVLAGEKLYPYIIVTAYKIMYPHLPNVVIPYNMKYAIMATTAAICCTMAATVFACYKELAAQPAVLMRPPAPKQGKRVFLERITFIWKRLSFIWKSTIRNLIRYKKRFFMTVFGIGGCMALILVGYGLRDSIYNIAVIQYEDIQKYDMMTILDEDASKEESQALEQYISGESELSDELDIYMKNMTIGTKEKEEEAYLFVPSEKEKFKNFVVLQDRRSKERYTLSEEDAVLTEKMARTLGVEAGDSIFIKDEKFGEKEIRITSVCENYMGHYLYLTKGAYEALFGEEPEYNTKIFQMKEYEEEKAMKIGEEMLATKAAINVQYMDNMRGRIEDMLTTLDSVIVVLITAAGMLAFVVLYNLNNINITERRRELATIKVLGFFDKEVAAYVYRENILLTIIGAIAGCGLGYLLHRFVIVTVEVDDVMFGRNIELKSYLIAMLFTIGFSAFVNWLMYFKLKKIDMVESLKSVE